MIDTEELWRPIPGFSDYNISNFGEVYNIRVQRMMRTSVNNFGHTKISLIGDDGGRYTLSVAVMVGEAFVEPPDRFSDQVVALDGNRANVKAENLVWRPRWFAWKYAHQMKKPQPLHYQNLPVRNVSHRVTYANVIEAGISEGLLFDQIWVSTYTGNRVYPSHAMFEVVREFV